MITYQMLGTNDLAAAKAFYDRVLAPFQPVNVAQTPRLVSYSFASGARLVIDLPHDGKPATVGNGSMTALACTSPEMVNEVYRIALDAGGTSEGEPGDRSGFGHFAYVRDLDGNKLGLAHMAAK